MAVLNQFTLPVSYEQFQELNQRVNPNDDAPPGCLFHYITEQNGSVTITDIWEQEDQIEPFYQTVAEATGMPMPEMSRQDVKKLLMKKD